MRATTRMVAVTVLVWLTSSRLPAQSLPGLSGTWRAESGLPGRAPDPSKPGHAVPAGKGGLTITQDEKKIVLTDGRLVEEYALDGSETTSYIHVSGRRVPVRSRARWNGTQLVMTYRFSLGTETRALTRTLSLDDKGLLITDVMTTGPSGNTHHVGRYGRQGRIM